MAACEETGTVVCLHVGSSGTSPATSPDAPSDTIGVLFFGYAMFAAVDWLYSRIPVRFPEHQDLHERRRHRLGRAGCSTGSSTCASTTRCTARGTTSRSSPADTFRRNFWVCAIDDPSAFLQRDVIGIENILVESDYPHADSTWPHTQQRLAAQLAGLVTTDEIARVTWQNAAAPVPSSGAEEVQQRSECLLTACHRRHRVRPGRAAAVGRTQSCAFGGVPYARASRRGGACPSRSRGRSRSTPPVPGAAPPQTVGGLDLVPGMIPGAAVGGLPDRRDLRRRRSTAVSRCWSGSRAAATGSAARRSRSTTATHLAERSTCRRRAQLPPGRARLARGRGRADATSRCATCAPRSTGCAPTSPRSVATPIASW